MTKSRNMKTVSASSTRGLFAILLGLIIVMWPSVAVRYIVVIIGVLALTMGAATMISYLVNPNVVQEERAKLFPYTAILVFIFGLLLVLFPSTFVTIIMLLLGFIIVWVAVSQLIGLLMAQKKRKFPWVFYVFPVLILISGIVVFLNPFSTATAVFLLFGGTMIFYGLSALVIR